MPSKVDDFWAQLKSSNAPKKKVADTALHNGSINAQYPEGRPPIRKNDKPSQSGAHAALSQEGSREHDEPVCNCAFEEDHFRHRLQQLAEAFRSENSGTRRQALSEAKALVLGSSRVPAPPEAVLTDVVEQHLGKALLRRFDDQSEGCRELAATTFLGALHSPKEPSEEVRLVLAQIVVLLIRLGGKAISAYAAEVVGFVVVMSEDPFHEVVVQACAAVVELNACLGMRLHSVSKQFVAQLLPLTTHKRHTVRIAALQAIKVVMHQNAHEMILEMIAWRDPNMIPIKAFYGDDLKVNFAGKLATDSHPMVRLEFLRTISDWMLNLRERVDHEPRLLPYALSALNDSCPQVVEEALVLLDKLGEQYEREHANDLKDTVYYLPHEAHGLGWQSVLQEEAAVAKGRAVTKSPQGRLPGSNNGTGSGIEEGSQGPHQLASFAFALLWLLLHLEAAKASHPGGNLSSLACASSASATTNSAAASSPPHVAHLCALLAEATGHASVDHMVAHFRAGLLHRCVPSACVSMALEARVLARLLLTFGDATQVPLLAHHAPSAATCLPCLCSLLLHLPYMGLSSQGASVGAASTCSVPCVDGAGSSSDTNCGVKTCAADCSVSSGGPGTAAGSGAAVLDTGPGVAGTGSEAKGPSPEAGSGSEGGHGGDKQSAAVLLSRGHGRKLLELLAVLIEQVQDGVPLVWALRCLEQACSTPITTTTPCNSEPGSNTVHSSFDAPCSVAFHDCIGMHSTASSEAGSSLVPPDLLWLLLPRLSQALCQRSLRSASPTVRMQGCRATTQLLQLLCKSDLGGDREVLHLLSALQHDEESKEQEKGDAAASAACQGVVRDRSSSLPGEAMQETTGSVASGNVEGGRGARELEYSLQHLSIALLSLVHGDARHDVVQASLAALHALLHCFQRLCQHCQNEQAAKCWLAYAADVLRHVMRMQQGDEPLRAGLAQKVVLHFESWPKAIQLARNSDSD
ncbi:armadillo-type protein [Dunaliella salina]|uniref:Armadillo-type protein n=1 Tax=Dunaliella salina TaxID=3046 RepID=A0ABQ7H6Z9_DUNSA|nr:armadillo-type protein [Dunaliella salina]|eukprot:KAF5842633.1 armadillo-type protein [Dunaliella salina]